MGSWLLGCGLDGRLASQRIYTSSDIFLLLDKPFRLLVMVLVPVCSDPTPCLPLLPIVGIVSLGKMGLTCAFMLCLELAMGS